MITLTDMVKITGLMQGKETKFPTKLIRHQKPRDAKKSQS